MKRILLSYILSGIFLSLSCGQQFRYLDAQSGLGSITSTSGIDKTVTVRIIYDNTSVKKELAADWGYSALITGLDEVVLFDTGAKPGILETNFRALNTGDNKVNLIVLSHEHGDHTAGLSGFARIQKNLPVLIPESFSGRFRDYLVKNEYEPVLVTKASPICPDLYTSGDSGGPVPEQALIIDTKQGLVVMTGCSHPGIIKMLKEIKSTFNKNIYMVLGGFHLLDKPDDEMQVIIGEMKALGVVRCGATHCTGERQIKLIKEAFGPDFVELGVGNSVVIN